MVEAKAQLSSKMAQGMKDTPMYKSYVAVAPSPGDFPKLLDAMGDMMKKPFDWSADVAKLTMPVMLVYGDGDMYRPEHVVKFYQLLGGGLKDAGWQRENMSGNRLAILPGLTHYDIFLSPQLPATVLPFLDGNDPWSALNCASVIVFLHRIISEFRLKKSHKFGLAFILLAAVLALIAAVLALPVAGWRTGRSAIEPLSLAPSGTYAVTAQRVWVDTDASCGASRTSDPDDCLALLALLKSRKMRVVGISTVFGNALIEVTDRTTRDLVGQLAAEGFSSPPVYLGQNRSFIDNNLSTPTPAENAIRNALSEAPMGIIALGPLTNIADVLRRHPELSTQVLWIVAVVGQRPGHVFHPVEGGAARVLLGHGPVFRDFNFAKDRLAVAELLSLELGMTFIPYEAAEKMAISAADLDAMDREGVTSRWVAERSRKWLAFWREDIRQQGFFPFDLVAAAYLLHPELFRCVSVRPRIGKHSWYWRWMLGDTGLFVDQRIDGEPGETRHQIVYCPSPSAGLHDAVLADLALTATPH